ncbi:MAG: tetratricopeptide repeat protein [Rhodopirellula sp.]|nr:tetratricopeptide repeat protein [Rhodopirellula sp.]
MRRTAEVDFADSPCVVMQQLKFGLLVAEDRHLSCWRLNSKSIVTMGCVLASVLGLFWYFQGRPQRLYEEAQTLVATDLAQAEKLLELATASAGGNFPEAEFLHCRVLAAQRRWNEALGVFGRIADTSKLDPAQLVQFAGQARTAGANLLMQLALRAAKQPGPGLPDVLRQLIRIDIEAGRFEVALQECRELLALEPEDGVAWRILGTIHLEKKEPLAAEAAFLEAIPRINSPEEVTLVRQHLIEALLDVGKIQDARQQLKTASEAGLLSDEMKLQEAYLDRLEGHIDAGIQTLQALLEKRLVEQQKTRAHMLLGLLWLDKSEPDKAVVSLETVVARQPFNKEAHHKLAQAYHQTGQPEKARLHSETAQQLTEQAVELLDKLEQLRADPTNSSLRQRVGDLYDLLGKPEQADRVRRVD